MRIISVSALEAFLDDPSVLFARRALAAVSGGVLLSVGVAIALALATWTVDDPSLTHATSASVANWMGRPGALFADPAMQLFGLAAPLLALPFVLWGVRLMTGRPLSITAGRVGAGCAALCLLPGFLDAFPVTASWPLPLGLGGVVGWAHGLVLQTLFGIEGGALRGFAGGLTGILAAAACLFAVRPARQKMRVAPLGYQLVKAADDDDEYGLDETDTFERKPSRFDGLRGALAHVVLSLRARLHRLKGDSDRPSLSAALARTQPHFAQDPADYHGDPRTREDDHARPTLHPEDHSAFHDDDDFDHLAEANEREAGASRQRSRLRVRQRVRSLATSAPSHAAGAGDALTAERPTIVSDDFQPYRLPSRGPAAKLRDNLEAALNREGPDETAYGTDEEEADHDFDVIATEERNTGAAAWDDVSPNRDGHASEDYDDDAVEFVDDASDAPAHDWDDDDTDADGEDDWAAAPLARQAAPSPAPPAAAARRAAAQRRAEGPYEAPPLDLLAAPSGERADAHLSADALEATARDLEGVLEDFGVRGSIIEVRPGPVVTLYELEPAPGIKSSRVIGLADDIARSMSAISARVAVIPGKNAIGIELPNRRRVTVFLREILASEAFSRTKGQLPLCLGKTIGGEAVIADLASMPHLLVAGTTGSGKSVSINTMILSLLYHHTPETCRVIMIDPKMLELSVYDGIPHLLTPVVTDPKKAVTALKWAVREMEDRYQKMAKLGVRNLKGFNARLAEARRKNERLTRVVQTGFDAETGEPILEEERLELTPIPSIVVIVDEMANLMLVAGKDIEGVIQRLAQMARAAGIHLIMATQRPSVDVITGTIKANFPTRISFQVTSKIDSRTILGEMGAEQLLGMGDMLYMERGGRIQRVHGPFVGDDEVEDVVAHLKTQGTPDYLLEVLEEDDEGGAGSAGATASGLDGMAESEDLYDRAVALVVRDGKASTSYVQRRLSIGYNRAATLIERMENEGVVSPANHAGKREILVPREDEAA